MSARDVLSLANSSMVDLLDEVSIDKSVLP